MHKKFNHEEIEQKWQKSWKESGIYNLGARDTSKEKEYVLVEWPYPSGNLHVGHWFAFAVVDIYVRVRRMQGKQVLFPIGFDAFGLPAEIAAIKNKLDPKSWTENNIAYMKKQLESMGNAFSWDVTTSSTDPEYFKMTQWMFTQFFEKGIAYRGVGVVNWCPGCNTVIANEQVTSDNTCHRCGSTIIKKDMAQWMLRITDYADRLIDDLDTLTWAEPIKEAQRQWIGRSKGATIPFTLSTGDTLDIFTTRPDTLYGATYVVLAPEHDLVLKNKEIIQNWAEVEVYIKEASQKDEILRTKVEKGKTGVCLTGITTTNPATGESIPVFIADYVIKGYGTGAIMAVPAHDERDFAFAWSFNLPVIPVVRPKSVSYSIIEGSLPKEASEYLRSIGELDETRFVDDEWGFLWKLTIPSEKESELISYLSKNIVSDAFYADSCGTSNNVVFKGMTIPSWSKHDHIIFKGKGVENGIPEEQLDIHPRSCAIQGILINSGEFTGMDSEKAKGAITLKVGGELTNTYRLRDWSIGRQRYWGVPIPIVYDPEGKPHPIPKEHLPWHLPTDVDFAPTGEPPLAKSDELCERVTRIFGEGWTPEVETMDTFVDSSWYFLRYLDTQNTEVPASLEAQKTWMPVDVYFGGSEHTTMHVLYSRFWQKALFDLGLVTAPEPYKMRINRGLVLGPDGNKMSKSKGNVVDPDEQVKILGADTVKMYLAFMGPYGELANYPWDMGGIVGQRRFLERVYGLHEHITQSESEETTKLIHKTILKVTHDILVYKFNTAISGLMIFLNHAEKAGLTEITYELFLTILAPFAPHLTEELWHARGKNSSIHLHMWPIGDSKLTREDNVTISVQVSGKLKGTLTVPFGAEEATVMTILREDASLCAKIPSEPSRVVFVMNRILNLVP